MLRIAQFQPEIPQNTGTILRLGACMGIEVDIIEPCSFGLSDARLKRAGMDYVEISNYLKHSSWEEFKNTAESSGQRLVYLTPDADISYTEFEFQKNDTLILGRESDGIPKGIASTIPYHIKIPMQPDRRSLNVAIAGAMVLGEALRQTDLFY